MLNGPSKPRFTSTVLNWIFEHGSNWRLVIDMTEEFFIEDLVRGIPRDQRELFDGIRVGVFELAQQVYDERAAAYNIGRACYESQVYGPLSLVSELYNRVHRLASLTSPAREEPLRQIDIKRLLDNCVDIMNYSSWLYAMIIMLTDEEFIGQSEGDEDGSS